VICRASPHRSHQQHRIADPFVCVEGGEKKKKKRFFFFFFFFGNCHNKIFNVTRINDTTQSLTFLFFLFFLPPIRRASKRAAVKKKKKKKKKKQKTNKTPRSINKGEKLISESIIEVRQANESK
jgi:hypothetical protein